MTRKTIAFKVLGAGPELESWIESCEAPFAPQAEREPATAAVTAGRPVSMDGDPPTQRSQLPALSSPSRMAPTEARQHPLFVWHAGALTRVGWDR